jgi:hypothetical protein
MKIGKVQSRGNLLFCQYGAVQPRVTRAQSSDVKKGVYVCVYYMIFRHRKITLHSAFVHWAIQASKDSVGTRRE